MKYMVKAATLAAGIMVFSAVGFAQCKIVVIDMQKAVVESNEGKVKAASFDAKVAEWKAKLDKIQGDIDSAQNKLKTQSSLASAATINELNKTIKDKGTELTRMSEDAQKEVEEFRDQLLTPVMKVADDTMNALAAEKNYSTVLDLSAQNSTVVYSSKECDITEEVMKRMNAKPAAGTAGAAPAKPATTPVTPAKPAPAATAPKPPATTTPAK